MSAPPTQDSVYTRRLRLALALVLASLLFAGLTHRSVRSRLVPVFGLAVNYVRAFNATPGVLTVQRAPADVAPTAEPAATPQAPGYAPQDDSAPASPSDWPSYNRTLDSQRYSPLSQIDSNNAASLKVICTYDTQLHTSFQAGPLMVNGSLIATTEQDIFSIDPNTCREKWRTHQQHWARAVSRGAAYWDGLLFRGSADGRVLAYDFRTGALVWERRIADLQFGEPITAAPIAWDGLVFIGNAGGDQKGGRGRMYALDARTGHIEWEFYVVPKKPNEAARGPVAASPLDQSTWGNDSTVPISGGGTWTSYSLDSKTGELYVPAGNAAPDFAAGMRKGHNLFSGTVLVLDAKTGAYKRHFSLTNGDWHDWDVSNAPALIRTRAGKHLLAVAPKNGFFYGFDLDDGRLLYRTAVTRMENADTPFVVGKPVRFCPGTRGGAEWNGASYDPQSNLALIGEVDWCSSVTLQSDAKVRSAPDGTAWSGMDTHNPYHIFGTQDPHEQWGGWLYALDADTGTWRWRARSNYPIQGGITTTAGGVAFFGDMGGNFYALETATGRKLWWQNLGGAVGGGVATYSVNGAQRVAVVTGFTAVLWPTQIATGKIVILGLPTG